MVCLQQSLWVLAFIYPNEHNFSPFETGMVRGGSSFIFCLFICSFYQYPMDFKPSLSPLKPLNIRNLSMALQGVTLAIVQFYLPLPIVHIITCSGSIFIAIIDYLRNGVELNYEQTKGIIFGFIGLAVVINDDVIFYLLGYKN